MASSHHVLGVFLVLSCTGFSSQLTFRVESRQWNIPLDDKVGTRLTRIHIVDLDNHPYPDNITVTIGKIGTNYGPFHDASQYFELHPINSSRKGDKMFDAILKKPLLGNFAPGDQFNLVIQAADGYHNRIIKNDIFGRVEEARDPSLNHDDLTTTSTILECRGLEWTDQPHVPWTTYETSEGQVVVEVKITQIDFRCFYKNEEISGFGLQITFKEKARKDKSQNSCNSNVIAKTRQEERKVTTESQASQNTSQISTATSTATNNTTTTSTTTTTTTTTATKTTLMKRIKLERWREYELKITITDPKTKTLVSKVVKYNTYQWQCEDPSRKVIGQEQFCNNIQDCPITGDYPNGRDEDPSVCRVSELPKNLGYLVYLFMLGFIFIYFSRSKPETNSLSNLVRSTSLSINIILPNEWDILKSKASIETLIAKYSSIHNSRQIMSFCQYLKLWYYTSKDVDRHHKIFSCIRTAEQKMHSNVKERYRCILKNYGGDVAVTERICYPYGTFIDKLKICLQNFLDVLFLLTQGAVSAVFPWHILDIGFGFICLCSHMFDYIKDIDITTSLNHFDMKVIQRAYYQYNDFNLSYLTYTSICLMIASHIIVALYWATLQNKPNFSMLEK